MKLPSVWIPPGRSSVSGENASLNRECWDWTIDPEAGARPAFPPSVVVAVKALACELPAEHGIPLSRFSIPDIHREVLRRGLVASLGESTLWRWLSQDAIRPWRFRTWIFPRDPAFEEKAGRVLDLYQRIWQGEPLGDHDFVISTDEKTSIQARFRKHPTRPPSPGREMRVEAEYHRKGALIYLAAWDIQRARLFGRCEPKMSITAFDQLVHQVMSQQPYCSASRVFWIMDNVSSHRGQACADRLRRQWPNLHAVHTPVHASWLNQIEIYFSVVQRKVLSPNDFQDLQQLETRLLDFQDHYQEIARPFAWKFTRGDLKTLLTKLRQPRSVFAPAA